VVDIVRPAASFVEIFPGADGGSNDSVSSREKGLAAWYGERARLLTVKQGRGSTGFAKKTGSAKKASLANKISPAKKVAGKSTQATRSKGSKQSSRQSTPPAHGLGTIQASIERMPDLLKRAEVFTHAAPLSRTAGPEKEHAKKHSTIHSTIHSTLRFRTKSAVTLKSAGQPAHASRPHSSTSANPPSRLQSVRIRSVRR
jgi:hypothetical protein